MYNFLYIFGAGHCGSTLLNLILNEHEEAIGLSELTKFSNFVNQTGENNPLDRPFWKEVKQCYETSTNYQFEEIPVDFPPWFELQKWPEKKLEKWNSKNKKLLDCIAKISGSSLLVDSSKFPHRLYQLLHNDSLNLRVIHLLRDGRAVLNSYIRHHESFMVGFRRWFSPALLAFYLKSKINSENWLEIKYEDLAQKPAETTREICTFLSMKYDENMLSFKSSDHFGLGGNRMRKRDNEKIKLDTRWKDELSLSNRIKFNLLGGWLNKIYGY